MPSFDSNARRRINDAVKHHEMTPRNVLKQPKGIKVAPGGGGGKVFFTTSTISVATMASGTFTMGSGTAIAGAEGDTGVYTAGDDEAITIYNGVVGGTAVATSKVVICMLVDGKWVVSIASCT